MGKELEQEAEKYAKSQKMEGFDSQMRRDTFTRYSLEVAYKKGATSKYVKKQKLEFAIKQLNKLDSILQDKYKLLSEIQKEHSGKMKEGHLASKKSGLKLIKEEIRRDIKELEQELSEL